jgi:transposase-like protein
MRAEVLVGPERRRRWTAEQKLRIVEEAFEHGVRVADVARRRDVSRAQIYQWRAELGGNDRSAEAGRDIVGFVPVEIAVPPAPEQRSVAASAPAQVIEIGLAGGRSLKVPSSLPTAELRRLIRVVEGA